jgi:Tol biopolymer transport system component
MGANAVVGCVAWAPDGKMIAFERTLGIGSKEHAHIYVVRSSGGTPRQVTFGPGNDDCPVVWSPNGKKIAYLHTNDHWRVEHIFTTSVSGGSPLRVTNGHDEESPAWSPDGRKIVYVENISTTLSRVFIAPASGGAPTPITKNNGYHLPVDPSWSPDSSKIAYTDLVTKSGDFHIDIRILSASGSPLVTYRNADHPAWSPNGKKIVYIITGSQNSPVLVRPALGGAATRIASQGDNGDPSWAPDGKEVVFWRDNTGPFGSVFVVSAAGGHAVRLPNPPLSGLGAEHPAWSPKGPNEIAYLGDKGLLNGRGIYIDIRRG